MELGKFIPVKNKRGFLSRSHNFIALAASLLLITVLFTSCAPGVVAQPPSSGNNIVNAAPAFNAVAADENTIIDLYEKNIPAVVMVQVTIGGSNLPDPFGFGAPQQRGQGSGFVIDTQGHILTNNHVVGDASKIKIVLHNGKTLDAEIVGTDEENDLGLIKVDPVALSGIKPLTLGDSDAIRPGQLAVALGSPYGLEGSITTGIVSGIGRSLPGATRRPIANVIQTDAAINPGNSGGPLLNSKGEVIGINTAIEPSSNGIGFCVPINTAKSLLPQLIKGGEVKNAWLGISGLDIDDELATQLKLPVKSGIYVVNVTKDSPAETAGLKGSGEDQQREPNAGGDIITAVDGKNVDKVESLVVYFNSKAPGDKVTLSVYRDGRSQNVEVTLGEWPSTSRLTLQPRGTTPPPTPTPGSGFDFGPFHFDFNFDWKLPFPEPKK
jgi:S1-C subfamily serine protease